MSEQTTQYRQAIDRLTVTSLLILLTLVIGLLSWGIYHSRHYSGLTTVDVLDQAQVARHLHLGKGFTTGFLKPLSLNLRREKRINPPDFYNSPLPILSLSLAFQVMDVTDEAVLGSSIFWSFLTSLLLLIFARILFRNLILALLAFLIYSLNPGVLESSFSGLPLNLLSFLLLSFALVFYLRKRSSLIWTVLLGILSGLLYLGEFDFLFLAIPLAIFTALDSENRRWVHLLTFAAAFIFISFPWWIRNTVVAGNPFFSLRWLDFKEYTLVFPGNRIIRDFSLFSAPLSLPFSVFWSKFMMFSRLMYRFWLTLSHSPVLPFFLAGCLLSYPRKKWGRLVRLILILFLLQLGLIAAGNGDLSRVLVFIPLIILGGTAAFLRMLEGIIPVAGGADPGKPAIPVAGSGPVAGGVDPGNSPGHRPGLQVSKRKLYWSIVAAFCLVSIYPGFVALIYGLPAPGYISTAFSKAELLSLKESGNMGKIQNLSKSDEIIVSDIPWAIAWYGNRNSLWIPWEVEQMKEIKENISKIRFLYLTPFLFKYPESENVDGWQEIYRTGMVPDWLNVERGILLPGDNLLMGDILFERLDLE